MTSFMPEAWHVVGTQSMILTLNTIIFLLARNFVSKSYGI